MKTVKMFTTAASAEHVLNAGEVYTLPDKLADSLLRGVMVHGVTADGKPMTGGPCAVEVKGQRGKKPPPPDPEEHKNDEFVDEDEEDEDGD